MYRDDTCAVCGESLPPDHFYCREHAAEVDDRLREIGKLLGGVAVDLQRLSGLLGDVAQETWDYLAEHEPDEPDWPPAADVALPADAEDVDVDVDSEPGRVRVDVRLELLGLLAGLATTLGEGRLKAFADACAAAEGANSTH